MWCALHGVPPSPLIAGRFFFLTGDSKSTYDSADCGDLAQNGMRGFKAGMFRPILHQRMKSFGAGRWTQGAGAGRVLGALV